MTLNLHVLRSSVAKLALVVIFALGATLGCTPPEPDGQARLDVPVTTSDQALQQELDDVLDFTLQRRQLNTAEHGAWQVLHGVLSYQQVFPVQVGINGPMQSALSYLLDGGHIRGWTFQPGDVLDASSGRRGLRAVVEPGTKKGQGHADQWLAVLAQCDLPIDQPIKLNGQTFTMAQFVQQVQHDAPYNAEREWSWTLIGLSHYLPTDTKWTARDGETWSIERMVQSEIEQNVDESACGGTHRLIGVATALRRREAEGREITGVWQRARMVVDNAIGRALELQNPDGSFSTKYFQRPSFSPDMAIVLGSSGHVLEFLTVAMTDEQLKHPQVRLAVRQLCSLFRDGNDLALECGALYHASHGLVLFRERVFGPREYDWKTEPPAQDSDRAPESTSPTRASS